MGMWMIVDREGRIVVDAAPASSSGDAWRAWLRAQSIDKELWEINQKQFEEQGFRPEEVEIRKKRTTCMSEHLSGVPELDEAGEASSLPVELCDRIIASQKAAEAILGDCEEKDLATAARLLIEWCGEEIGREFSR